MLKPDIYWVAEAAPGRLAMMPKPRAGEWLAEEVVGWRLAGIRTVVSLLEPREVKDLGLHDEAALCAKHAIEFLSHPVPDRGTPASVSETAKLVDNITARMRDGQSVAIHCRAGIGRSGLPAACVLLRLGTPYDSVFSILSNARHVAVPDTPVQAHWVKRYGQTVEIAD